MVEANTLFGEKHEAMTGFSLTNGDDFTAWSLGLEGGYFVADNLAVKVGLGYYDLDNDNDGFTYKVGAKYYIVNKFPVALDYNGSDDDFSDYVGLQAGYAWFLGDNVAIEPGLRYGFALDSDKGDDMLQFNIGFSLFF